MVMNHQEDKIIKQIFEAIALLEMEIPKEHPVHIDLEYDDEEDYHYFTLYLEKDLNDSIENKNYTETKDYLEGVFNYIVLDDETKKHIFQGFEPFTIHNTPEGIEQLKKELLGNEKYSLYQASLLNSELTKKETKKIKPKI